MLMDWYYRPQIAAQLTESINYITPVPAAQPIIARDAAKANGVQKPLLTEVATSELVWPTPRPTTFPAPQLPGRERQEAAAVPVHLPALFPQIAIFTVGILCAIASVIIGWRKPT